VVAVRIKEYFTKAVSKLEEVYEEPVPRREMVPVTTEAVIENPTSSWKVESTVISPVVQDTSKVRDTVELLKGRESVRSQDQYYQ
jgi:hypothetical protein